MKKKKLISPLIPWKGILFQALVVACAASRWLDSCRSGDVEFKPRRHSLFSSLVSFNLHSPPSPQFSNPYFSVLQLLKNRWVVWVPSKVLFSFCNPSFVPWCHRASTPHPTWLSSTRLCDHSLSRHLVIPVARLLAYRLAARIVTWKDRLQSACPWLFSYLHISFHSSISSYTPTTYWPLYSYQLFFSFFTSIA